MSDKKDRRSNSETEANPEALPQETQSDQRKQRLLDAAKKRLASIDVGSDGKYAGDHAFRSDTLAFLEKECLNLPDQKFFTLLSQIESILLQRDAERAAVRIETEMALDALVSWVEKPKLRTVAWNGMREVFGSDQKILKTNFAPDGYDPKKSAKHLHYYMSSEKRRTNFRDEVESNPKRAAGLIVHWTEEHPVRKALLADGKKEVVTQIDEIRLELLRLHKPLWASGDALKNLSKIEGIVAKRRERLSHWSGFEQKIWQEGFWKSVKTDELADYVEYLTSVGGNKTITTFFDRITKNRTALLWFVENVDDRHPVMLELKKRGNPEAAETFMGLRKVVLAKYNIPDPLPTNFSKNKNRYVDNFERQEKNAEELKEFNKGAKKELEGLWDKITEAYYSGDYAAAAKIGKQAEEYFKNAFSPRFEKARADFSTIPEYNHPQEYKTICRMASVRMLFRDLTPTEKTDGDQIDEAVKFVKSWVKNIGNMASKIGFSIGPAFERRAAYSKAFQNALGGGHAPSLVFNSDGKVQTKTLEEFGKMLQGVTEGRTEISSDGFARYVSYLHDTLGPEKLRTELQSRWNGKYEDLVLKFGNLWGLFEGAPKNSAAQRIMGKISPEALLTFKNIVKQDGECVIRKRANGGLPDIEANLRKTSWLDEKKIAEILSELRKYDGDPTKQFDVLCQKIENVSYSTVLSFFKKNADQKAEVSETLREQADRTISPKIKMAEATGFNDLLYDINSLSKEQGNPAAASRFSSMAKKMSDSSESTSAAFLQKIPEKELREILDVAKAMHSRKIPSSNPSRIGVFANWLEAKLESRKTEIAANVSAGIAHKAHEQTVRSGKNPGEAISEAEKKELWLAMTDIAGTAIKASEARRVADALRSEGKEAAAAEITRQITGKDSWDARTAIWERARMSEGISNLERIGFFERNKGGEIDLESAKSTIYKAYPNTAKDSEAPAEKSAITYSNKASSFFQESSVGETANVGNACFATKTASGGLEIVSWGRKLRFEKSEALGATQQLDMLITANAEFLIPAMKDVALTSKIDLRNGIGREEARKMLSSVALALGYDDIADEVDPRVLLGKFRAASEGAFWGPSLSERMRKYGIVDELGSLNRDGLRKRMIAITSRSREETVGA